MSAQDVEIISSLYRAPFVESGWQAFFKGILAFSNSYSGTLSVLSAKGLPTQTIHCNHDDGLLAQWENYYVKIDPWVMELSKRDVNRFYTGDSLVAPREFYKSEIYNDFTRKLGVKHATGAVISSASKQLTLLVTLQQSQSQGATNEHGLDRLNQLIPHMQSCMESNLRYSMMGGLPGQFLDRVEAGAFLCDETGYVRQINRAAEILLVSSNSLVIDAVGRLNVSNDRKAIIERIASLKSRHGAGSQVFSIEDQSQSFQVSISKLIGGDEDLDFNEGRFLVVVQPLVTKALQNLGEFGFTLSERRVANLLIQGIEPKKIAEKLSVKEGTVRTHIKAILRKSDSRNMLHFLSRFISSRDMWPQA